MAPAAVSASTGTCTNFSTSKPRSVCQAQKSCSNNNYNTQASCTANTCTISGYTTQSTCTAAHVCSKSQYTTQSQCTSHNGTWNAGVWGPNVWRVGHWTPNNHSTWNGCVWDRGNASAPSSGNYDENVSPPVAGDNATLYPAYQASPCPEASVGLNANWSAMTTLVNNMTAGGSTNQPIGLVWAWQTIVGGGPFTVPDMDPNYTYQQVIILLSDGLNTKDRWYGDGSTTSTQVNSRMLNSSGQGTCTNIKTAPVATGQPHIIIYTIQVNTGGDPTSTLLQNCATDVKNNFFEIKTSGEIVTVFDTIATKLKNLYLAM